MVFATLDTDSYAIVLYPRDGIQFTTSPVENGSGILHAGFSKGLVRGFIFSSQGQYYRTTTDDEASIRALAE